jgi:hypothetical protein
LCQVPLLYYGIDRRVCFLNPTPFLNDAIVPLRRYFVAALITLVIAGWVKPPPAGLNQVQHRKLLVTEELRLTALTTLISGDSLFLADFATNGLVDQARGSNTGANYEFTISTPEPAAGFLAEVGRGAMLLGAGVRRARLDVC